MVRLFRGEPALVDRSSVPGADLDVSIVMPCLNEAETLEFCIVEAQAALAESGLRGEIVIADNGSTDGSREIAARLGARVVEISQKGYGSALLGGIAATRGEFIVMGDADASYDFGQVSSIVSKLQEGYELVMGNRFLGGVQPGAMPWHHRYIGNPLLSGVGRLFFRCPARDFHCGLRGFRKDAISQLDLSTSGMEFASEMLIKATLGGLKIVEVPTVLRPDGRSRPPHLRSFRDGWRHLRFMLLYCPFWLFAVLGMLLFLAGTLFMGLIAVTGGLIIGSITLSVNTSSASAMVALVGCQLVILAAFARRLFTAMGVQPEPRVLALIERHVTLEIGVLGGLFVVLLGSLWFGTAFLEWRAADYGGMTSDLSVRTVIPSLTLILVGVQVVFGSFLMSIIGLIPFPRTHSRRIARNDFR
ncbi:MAG: glycosyltransferase family 2 protein [Planctomycetaceae bacterium]|nr:glycosyltransferase family 2 protein [Planctomycetaceae bacterium]